MRAPPEDGKANAELVELAAEALGVPPARVRVSAGQTSRRKTLSVEGIGPAEVQALLASFF